MAVVLAGLIGIANAVRIREQRLQARGTSFIGRDMQTDSLVSFPEGKIIDGPTYASMLSHMDSSKGVLRFKGILLTDKGSAGALELQGVRKIAIEQITDRFAQRSVLDQFGWLDLTTWPQDPPPDFAEGNLKAIFSHWEQRLHRWNINFDDLKSEFDLIKTVFASVPYPINDSWNFWRRIICNTAGFSHAFLFAPLFGPDPI